MKNSLASVVLLLATQSLNATSCEMVINQEAFLKQDLGMVSLSSVGSNFIWFSPSSGDKTQELNTNDLYEVTDYVGSRYFRLNGKAYNHTGSGQTFIYDLAYAFNVKPPAGSYMLKSYTTKRAPMFGRTIDTIGDSITWWQFGRFLRCSMRDGGLKYDFNGNNYDVFGYQHDGNGGYKTTDVLNLMPSIGISDAYFVLIGTNDQTTASQTFSNIVLISEQLHQKNACAKIYISTLLPRNDQFNVLNQSINSLLRSYDGWCDKCSLVDLGGYMYSQPNWPTYLNADKLHPNREGYTLIGNYLGLILT